MSAPQLNIAVQGGNPISADNLNTYLQGCDMVTQLRALIGVPGVQVYLRGFSSIADGGQGFFYWNAGGIAADDNGLTTVVPNGTASGEWTRLTGVNVNNYSYLVPLTGFTITFPSYTSTLILNPAGTLSAGTIIMPAALLDGQVIAITSSQTVTTLTLTANTGQTLVGAPTTITASTPIKFIYRAASKTLYRW